MIYVFTRGTNFIGKFFNKGDEIFFEGQNSSDAAYFTAVIQKILPNLTFKHIQGFFQDKTIVDMAISFSIENENFWYLFADKLEASLPGYYLVPVPDKIVWSSLEEELGTFLGNGMLEDAERDAIVTKLPRLTQEEVFLTHFLLKRMAASFDSLIKK